MKCSTYTTAATTLLAATLFAFGWAFAPHAAAYVDPTTGAPHASRVIKRADIPEKNWMPGHRGVDLDLRIGAPVLAAEAGIVAFAGVVAGTPSISIDHRDGIRTTYLPVHPKVRVGDTVEEGSVIGTLARHQGPDSRHHRGLHWGALIAKDTYINPLDLLARPKIVLKPIAH